MNLRFSQLIPNWVWFGPIAETQLFTKMTLQYTLTSKKIKCSTYKDLQLKRYVTLEYLPLFGVRK